MTAPPTERHSNETARTAQRRRPRRAVRRKLRIALVVATGATLALSSGPVRSAEARNAGPASVASAPAVAPRPSSGCGAATIATGRRIEQTIDVGGVTREYILDVPETLAAGEPAALLFDFHGVGHSGAGVWNVSGFRELAPRERFITVYPTGLPVRITRADRTFGGPGWEIRTLTPNRDVDFTLALLDHLERTYCVDRARVFSTGFSNGGFFSHVLACTHPDRFAAIAPVSGGWLASWSCAPSRPVPVLIQHGRQDDIIDVAEARRAFDAWLAVAGCATPPEAPPAAPGSPAAPSPPDVTCRTGHACRDGTTVELCEGDFAHRWPPSATRRVWDFLRAHPLGPRS